MGFVDPLLPLISGDMDPLQMCDTEDCAWTTLDDLCETNWEGGYFTLTKALPVNRRKTSIYFTYKTPGSCFEKWPSVLWRLGWRSVFLFCGERHRGYGLAHGLVQSTSFGMGARRACEI